MLTPKIITLFFSIILLILIGSFLRNETILISSIPLFSYLIFLLIFKKEIKLDLEIKRNLNKEIIREDEELEVKLEISNKGDDLDYLYIIDSFQEGIELIGGSNAMLMKIKKNETKTFSYVIKVSEIGKYKIGPLELIAFDNTGSVFEKKDLAIHSSFKASPKISLFGEIKLKPKFTKSWPGEYAARAIGTGGEFYSVAELRKGEIAKRINWKATARTGKIMKNVYHAELSSDALIILDYRSSNDIMVREKSLLLYSAKASLLLAYRLLREKHRVGLLVMAEEIYRIAPSFGRKQFDRILYAVLDAEPGKLTDMRLLKDLVSLMFPITTQVIFISPILDVEVVLAIAELSKRGYQVICIIPNPFESKPEAEMDLIDKLIRIERENYLHTVEKFANVLEWDMERSLDIELRKASTTWARLRR